VLQRIQPMKNNNVIAEEGDIRTTFHQYHHTSTAFPFWPETDLAVD
jgi:hypothetical protein